MRWKKFAVICLSVLILPILFSQVFSNEADAQASGENSIFDVEISCGLDGYGKYNCYIPINLTVTNHGEDFVGQVCIIFGDDTYTDKIAYTKSFLAASGESRHVSLCVPESSMNSRFTLIIRDASGNELYCKTIHSQIWYTNDIFMGVLTDDFNALNYLEGMPFFIDSYGEYVDTRIFAFDANTFADTANGLDLLDVLVINDFDTSRLSSDQYNALKIWVSNGGILLIGTGPNYSGTLSLFRDDYLTGSIGRTGIAECDFGLNGFTALERTIPMEYSEEIITEEDYHEDGNDSQEKTMMETEATAVEDTTLVSDKLSAYVPDAETVQTVLLSDVEALELDTVELELDDSSRHLQLLCQSVDKGAGKIIVFSFDLGMEPFGSWKNAMYVMEKVFHELTDIEQCGSVSDNFGYWYIENMLSNYIADKLPGIGRYIVLLAVYILLVSPLTYIILKKADRRHYFWGIVPALACVFTVMIFLFGNSTRHKDPYINYSAILNADEHKGLEKTYFSVTSPGNHRYSFAVDESYMLSPVENYNYYYTSGSQSKDAKDYDMSFDFGIGETVVDVKTVHAFDSKYFMVERESVLAGSMDIDLAYVRDHYEGKITNNTGYRMEDVFIWMGASVMLLGDLDNGQSMAVDENTEIIPYVEYYSLADQIFDYDRNNEDDAARRKMLSGYVYGIYDNSYSYMAVKTEYRLIGFVQDYPIDVSKASGMDCTGNVILSQVFELQKTNDGNISIPGILGNSTIRSGDVEAPTHMFYSDEVELEYELPQNMTEILSLELTSEEYEPMYYYLYNWSTSSYDRIFENSDRLTAINMDDYVMDRKLRLKIEKEMKNTYSWVYLPDICLTGRD